MTILLLAAGLILAGIIVAHERGVLGRASRSSVTLAETCERQRRARMEAER